MCSDSWSRVGYFSWKNTTFINTAVRTSNPTNDSVGFEVQMIVTTKRTIFLDVTPCNLVEVYRLSGGTYFVLLFNRGSTFLRNVDKYLATRHHILE
jgi:hypothetical protein